MPMCPRERFLRCVRGETVDRVPLFLEGLHNRSREEVEQIENPYLRELAERFFPQTHYFVWNWAPVNRYLVTPPQFVRHVSEERDGDNVVVTQEIETPKGKLPFRVGHNPTSRTHWMVKYPVETLEDIEKIRSVRWELPPDFGPPDLSALPEDFERRGVLISGVSSPFVCVAAMMPFETFLEFCLTEFELMKELTEICLERILSALEMVLSERTIEFVWMGGSEWLTPPMASPRLYAELVQPYEKIVIERIHAAGALSWVHCHGNVRDTFDMVIERGADFFEPVEPPPDGDITFAEAKERAAGRMTLGGNVEARILECGGEAEVEAAARAAFAGGKKRMMLRNTAGPIGAMDERTYRNYKVLLDVWDECAVIDVPTESAVRST